MKSTIIIIEILILNDWTLHTFLRALSLSLSTHRFDF